MFKSDEDFFSLFSVYACFAGVNKHFHMVIIQHKLQTSTGVVVSNNQIWAHLKKLYDLASLVSSSTLICFMDYLSFFKLSRCHRLI